MVLARDLAKSVHNKVLRYKMNTEEKKAFNIEFWRFLWASILIGLSACQGNVVDAMIVGNLIDEDSVSAINLSLPTPSSQTSLTLNCLRN